MVREIRLAVLSTTQLSRESLGGEEVSSSRLAWEVLWPDLFPAGKGKWGRGFYGAQCRLDGIIRLGTDTLG